MIAISLIVLAAIPLLYPHVFLLKAQRQFMDRVELDHVINLLYADVIERLYKNEIPLNAILNKNVFEITDYDLSRIQYDKRLPFKGGYTFSVYHQKPRGVEDSPYTLYLLTLDFFFHPLRETPTESNTQRYHYNVFLVHDTGLGPLPSGEESSPEASPKPNEEPAPT